MPLLKAADLFCGAGGSTTGAEASGHVQVVYALNHWPAAVQSHSANHPHVKHVCAPVDWVDPRRDVPKVDLLMASPECTHHSIARGGRPVDDQKRATGWHVVHWTEALRPKWVIVENVREFLNWGPVGRHGKLLKAHRGETFKAWVSAMRSLGYTVEWRLLNAADYGEATRRIRFFAIARRGKGRGKIPWPEPTHSKENWRPAAEVIDWTRACPSIFSRKRPLAEKTLRRIAVGLEKFCGPEARPFIVKMRGTGTAGSIEDPVPTLTGGGSHVGVAQPFIVPNFGERDGQTPRTHSVGEPMPAVTSHGAGALARPFIVQYHGGTDPKRDGTERQQSLLEPLATIDTQPRYALAQPFVLPNEGFYRGNAAKSVDQPLDTITAKRGGGHVLMPFMVDIHDSRRDDKSSSIMDPLPTIVAKPGNSVVVPFLTQYNGTGGAESIDDPLTAITAKPRHGLALVKLMQELGIVDIGFRMLDVDELARAQGFPERYWLAGNKADQIRQIGNAVCPGVMRALCEAIGKAG